MKKEKKIKLIINEKNIGLAASLNIGIGQSKGRYIARMDADDISLPDRLQTQVNYLKNNPRVDILGSNAELIKRSNATYSNVPLSHKSIVKNMLSTTCIIHPTVMMKRTCFDKEGYDPTLTWAEDKDLWLRWRGKYQFANIDKVLLEYKVKSNISWKIFYYNHLVIWKHMARNNSYLSDSPHFFKSVFSHLRKLV